MSVDPREVEMMSRLRQIMDGKLDLGDTTTPVAEMEVGKHVDPTDDMKAILAMFNKGADEVVAKIKEEAEENRPLRAALITKKTENGVRMGSWEIKVEENAKGLKSYDVFNIHTGEPIAMDLTLYESALSLAKLLNFHVGINSAQIREVLDLEDKYARYRQDAALFKLRLKQRANAGELSRAAIAEDRYNEAKANALQLREKIQAFCRSL